MHRSEYLKVTEELRKSHKPPLQCSDEEPRVQMEDEDKKLVVLYHDESIYNMKAKGGCGPKTKGSGIMVADFIDEYNGYSAHTAEEQAKNPAIAKSARAFFEYGADKEGYWTGEKFMARVKNACDIAEVKYRPDQQLSLF